jgi:hypothetical protein
MGKAIRNLVAGVFDVRGVCHVANVVANVVVDAVTGLRLDGLRLIDTARSLLARLAWRMAAGPLAGKRYCLRPVHAGAARTPEPTSSGMSPSRLQKRLGRPRSATRVGRF